MSRDFTGGRVIANPKTGPNNGPVHGVATTVAKTPPKKDPSKGEAFDEVLLPKEIRDVPSSKTPKRLRLNKKSTVVKTATNTGSCS